MRNTDEIERSLSVAREELGLLDAQRAKAAERVRMLVDERQRALRQSQPEAARGRRPLVSDLSSPEEKIALFRSLFRGREDVYPRRFESLKTGRSGYHPACANEWMRPICRKPKGKCMDCDHRAFLPVTDATVRDHLLGRDADTRAERDFTIGVYPMLPDETCWFLAVDFGTMD